MRTALAAALLLGLAACSPRTDNAATAPAPTPAAAPALALSKPAASTAPAGLYKMDRGHTSVNFGVSHMGFSNYTARFTKVDGQLNFDPANPAAMSVTATIDPASIQTNYPDKDYDFDADLRGKNFFDTARFPQLTFKSTRVEPTGANTARVTGDLSLHGVTAPVVLDVTFNGGYAAMPMDPAGARIGFSAHGALKRSAFGMGMGVPEPGSNMGVGDEVEIMIETEFTKK
jgi:polyisoprenoid-binding protein YceI